jgi:hypothetical protein
MDTKQVTLPSGLVVTIKKPGILGIKAIRGTLPDLLADRGEAPEGYEASRADKDALLDAEITSVCVSTVQPKLTATDPPPEGYESIDVLDLADFRALQAAVAEFSGLRADTEKLRPLQQTGNS